MVFATVSVFAIIAGLVILGITLRGMDIYISRLMLNDPDALQISQTMLIAAYAGTSFYMAMYLFFLYAYIQYSVIYCKIPKNLTVHANVSIAAVSES